MIDLGNIRGESRLIDEALSEQLREVLAPLQRVVELRAVVELSREKDMELAVFLKKLVGLSEKLSLKLYTAEEAAAAAPELNAAWLPVTGLYLDGAYGRMAFHGVPGGKEINALVLALRNLAGPGQAVPEALLARIAAIDKPMKLQVCVSLACAHCQKVVSACQLIAAHNLLVQADMIDAALYKDLVERYKIERVPLLLANGEVLCLGEKSLSDILDRLRA